MLNANVFVFHTMVCFTSVFQQLNNFDNNIRKIIYDIGNYGQKLDMILKTIMIHGISNYLILKCHVILFTLLFWHMISTTIKWLSSKESIKKILGIKIYKKWNEKIYISNIFQWTWTLLHTPSQKDWNICIHI